MASREYTKRVYPDERDDERFSDGQPQNYPKRPRSTSSRGRSRSTSSSRSRSLSPSRSRSPSTESRHHQRRKQSQPLVNRPNSSNMPLQKNITHLTSRQIPTQSKENAGYSTQGNRGKTVASKSAAQHVPVDIEEDITEFVKSEIWRDVKFLSTDDEVATVAMTCMAQLPQLKHLAEASDKEYAENVKSVVHIYGAVITKAINQRRTDVTSALKKAYEKRATSGKTMPTPSQLRNVIYRKNMDYVAVPEEPAAIAPNATAQAKKAYNDALRPFQNATEYNAAVDEYREFFEWHWLGLLPAVCSKHRWGENLRRNCPITTGVSVKDPSKTLVTHTDEAFVLVTYENCDKRWPYCYDCKQNGQKPDKTHKEYQTRWCDDGAGQNKFGGWTNEGRKRFSTHVTKIAYNKQKEHVAALEDEILAKISKGKATTDDEDPEEEATEFGGKDGEVSFLNVDWSAMDFSNVASDDESLDNQYRKPKKPKTKS